MNKICTALAVALLLTVAGCAPGHRPFATPADAAMSQSIVTALGEYAESVYATPVGGRVYLEGSIPNFDQLQDALERVRSVPGVKDVVYDTVILTEIGSNGDGSNDWD